MKSKIKNAVKKELWALRKQVFNTNHKPGIEYNNFVNKICQLIEFMIYSPEFSAKQLSEEFYMDKNEVKLAYKIIQKSNVIYNYLKRSYNGDYLNIVNHYFNQCMYVLVFFVGRSCPAKCKFCPNVIVKKDGTRQLLTFIGNKENLLSTETIQRAFIDIRKIKESGKSILIKISGGLEPLTDTKTILNIIDNAANINVPVKLFTNGILLDNEERIDLALRASDIRISLSTLNEMQYNDILFGLDNSKNKKYSFKYLIDNITFLVSERKKKKRKTKIGLNTVILEENHINMKKFIKLAESLKLDYIDFKPNYFNIYKPKTGKRIEEIITTIKKNSIGKKDKHLEIYFANSLFRKNVFWKYKSGFCKPHKQGRFKMFITPYGVCTPIHHMAFPYIEEEKYQIAKKFQCGSLSTGKPLLDIIKNIPEMPDLEYNKLNPFECMLSLEIEREEKNKAWGIPPEYNPYDSSKSNILPLDIKENQFLKKI